MHYATIESIEEEIKEIKEMISQAIFQESFYLKKEDIEAIEKGRRLFSCKNCIWVSIKEKYRMNLQERYSVLSQKSVKHMDLEDARKIIENISSLDQNPFPSNSKRCKDPTYREKIFEIIFTNYRILYELILEEKIILVHKIEKKESAKNL